MGADGCPGSLYIPNKNTYTTIQTVIKRKSFSLQLSAAMLFLQSLSHLIEKDTLTNQRIKVRLSSKLLPLMFDK